MVSDEPRPAHLSPSVVAPPTNMASFLRHGVHSLLSTTTVIYRRPRIEVKNKGKCLIMIGEEGEHPHRPAGTRKTPSLFEPIDEYAFPAVHDIDSIQADE